MDTVPSASAAPAQDAPRSPAAPQTTTQAPGQVVADSPAPPSADVPAATASSGAQGAAATTETPASTAPHTIAGIPSRPARTTALAMQPGHAAPPSAAGTLGGTLFALALVLGLIFGLAWLARRMPGLAGTRGNGLRIVASTALGARERLVVVEVGGQQLLLATGTAGTRLLHTLETPLPVEAPAQPVPFAQLLAQQFGKKA